MNFEKTCMIFTMQEPYYGILLSSMNKLPLPASIVKTMGVARSGNVFKLGYNPDFVDKLSLDATIEVLKHEMLHIAFGHFTLWETEATDPQIKELRNIAEDMEINSYLDMNKMAGLHPVHPSQFGWDTCLGAREYYSRLTQRIEQERQQQGNPPTPPTKQDCTGNDMPTGKILSQSSSTRESGQSSGQGAPAQEGQAAQSKKKTPTETKLEKVDSLDDHSMWPTAGTQAEADMMNQIIEDMIVMAAEEVEKACGSIPGEMRVRIENIRKKRPRAATDWKRHFRRYLGNEFSELIRKSKKRESRRFPDAAGNRHRRKSHILVAIDTSGSVCMPEYQEFFGQIRTLCDSATFHVVECDTKINHEYDFKGVIHNDVHGGGGTDFDPPVQLFLKNRKKYDALVYFTDGCSAIPKDTPKETLWVISSSGNQDRARYRKNGASVVFIKPTN